MQSEAQKFEEKHKKADEKITNAQTNDGDLEIRDALVEKADIYLQQKDNENYRSTILKALEKTIGNAKKLEFYLLIVNSYFKENNFKKFVENLLICKSLTDESLDWEKKNKLAIYDGIFSILKRDIVAAANTLLGCVNTFNSPEIMSFKELVWYAVVLGLSGLHRKDVREKIIQNPEIISVLNENPLLKSFTLTIFESNYKRFFALLLEMNDTYLVNDILLSRHREFLLKRARIVIYSLFLESYKTVRLVKMAESFGVSLEFLDKELAELISQKYLNCKIDKVNLIVESITVDKRSQTYKEIEKKGDLLVERMHKLVKSAQV